MKRAILGLVLWMITFGLAGCNPSGQGPAEVDSTQEIVIDGPAFVLFFTDP